MRAATVVLVVFVGIVGAQIAAQTLNPTPREIIGNPRALTAPEVAAVLAAVQHAMDGKTFKLAYASEMPGVEVLMAANGRPALMRASHGEQRMGGGVGSHDSVTTEWHQNEHVDIVTITDYTRTPAQSCAGVPLKGQLVVEYEYRSTTKAWTVKGRTSGPFEAMAPVFDMLAGDVPATSGDLKQLSDRPARALVAPYRIPDGMQVSDAMHHATNMLWIDRETLLPLKLSIVVATPPEALDLGAPPVLDIGLRFFPDAAIDIQRPAGVAAPNCVR